MNNVNKIKKCSGCGTCTAVCPKGIIQMRLDEDGFYKPVITNEQDCINCGKCLKVCSSLSETPKKNIIGSYSASSKDDYIIKNCSSGGIAYEIARYLNKHNYNICGCEYNVKDQNAVHKIVKSIDEYEKCMGSKYIQSKTENALHEMIKGLKNEDKFVFFGTPCQVAGVSKMAIQNNIREKIVLVDFFCHGIPSYFLWKNYLNFIKENKKLCNIQKVNFRDKNKGWHEYTLTTADGNTNVFSQSLTEGNWFFKFFLSDVCLNDVCYDCKFRADQSFADIRVGDLWCKKYMSDRRGMSAVLTFTEIGDKIIKELSNVCKIDQEATEIVIEEQIKSTIPIPTFRKSIIKDLKNNKSFPKIYYQKVIPSKIIKKLKGEN